MLYDTRLQAGQSILNFPPDVEPCNINPVFSSLWISATFYSCRTLSKNSSAPARRQQSKWGVRQHRHIHASSGATGTTSVLGASGSSYETISTLCFNCSPIDRTACTRSYSGLQPPQYFRPILILFAGSGALSDNSCLLRAEYRVSCPDSYRSSFISLADPLFQCRKAAWRFSVFP